MTKRKKMDFFMNNNQLRKDLRIDYPNGVYTLDLIRDGKRFATTRPSPLGKVGEKVILYNSKDSSCKEQLVEIVSIEHLNIATSEQANLWSQKEGWSAEYLKNHIHLCTDWQTTFRLAN